MPKSLLSDSARFLQHVDKQGPVASHMATRCWLWKAAPGPTGYGSFKLKGKQSGAHRAAYALFVGEPGNFSVLHHCDVRLCVNPEHLYLGTQRDNMRDAASRGRIRNRAMSVTHCPKGHAYSVDNTRIDASGGRRCRACEAVKAELRAAQSGCTVSGGTRCSGATYIRGQTGPPTEAARRAVGRLILSFLLRVSCYMPMM